MCVCVSFIPVMCCGELDAKQMVQWFVQVPPGFKKSLGSRSGQKSFGKICLREKLFFLGKKYILRFREGMNPMSSQTYRTIVASKHGLIYIKIH